MFPEKVSYSFFCGVVVGRLVWLGGLVAGGPPGTPSPMIPLLTFQWTPGAAEHHWKG